MFVVLVWEWQVLPHQAIFFFLFNHTRIDYGGALLKHISCLPSRPGITRLSLVVRERCFNLYIVESSYVGRLKYRASLHSSFSRHKR